MPPEKLNLPQASEKDQLLDQLNSLDKNQLNYQAEKDEIKEKLRQISENPEETINALNLRAETKLSEVDKFKADQKHQKLEDTQSVDQLLSEINSMTPESLDPKNIKPESSIKKNLLLYIHFHQLDITAEVVKKAIRSFNWRSFKQLSKTEKESLCAQIDNIVNDTKVSIAEQYQATADITEIGRFINESRYQIQKIADDRHIKIHFEY